MDHPEWMLRGSQLHAAGQPEQALIAFENALALMHGDVNTASACAALLSELDRPIAAYKTLLTVQTQLLEEADGAANLAIAAEACGDLAAANNAYQRALALNPKHLRALNNAGLLAASNLQWPLAIDCARQCVALSPAQASYHLNLADALCGARDHAQALTVLQTAATQCPGSTDIRIRQVVVLAFLAEFEASNNLLQSFTPTERDALQHFLRNTDMRLPDAQQLYMGQAFEAMAICDWAGYDTLTAVIRQLLADCQASGQMRDWQGAAFHALTLDLLESEMTQLRRLSLPAHPTDNTNTLPAFVNKPRLGNDGRMHIGWVVQSLHDERYTAALQQQLALHDATRFAIHIYSPTPQPGAARADLLSRYAASMVAIAHMTDSEAAGRIRLDRLDLLVDMTQHTVWCRPAITEMRVAPVQITPHAWHRQHLSPAFDYSVSDHWVHPDGFDATVCGPVVRLPQTCYPPTHDSSPVPAITREQAGLPDEQLVLCCFAPPSALDPFGFGVWMKILRSLPDAVLWLPNCDLTTATHLTRQAEAAGVNSSRLLFAASMPHAKLLACLQCADLFLDTLRLNASQGLVDALRLGVPAISYSGNSMASRLGGSILRAAGLADCVFETEAAYVAEALRLGRQPDALKALRTRLKMRQISAPLFEAAARVKHVETAWAEMIRRSNNGRKTVAFDVADFSVSNAAAS